MQNKNNVFIKARALLDLGSQVTIVRTNLVSRLGVKRYYTNVPLVGIGGVKTNDSQAVVTICFKPINSDNLLSVTAIVLKKPTTYFAKKLNLNCDNNLSSADTVCSRLQEIDIIFGCDILGKIINGDKISLGKNGPYALGTIFDFAIFGPVQSDHNIDYFVGNSLLETVEKFWRTEEPPQIKIKDPLDIECERLFLNTTSRGSDGKYTVRLPLLPECDRRLLGDSRKTALSQFYSLERRMGRNPEFRDKYVNFMKEYLELGHMQISTFDFNSGLEHYFIGHHGVFKKSGDVSKIRVVFNGSEKTSSGVSLNDCLYCGERLQNDITDIILNFRWPRIVFTADVKMMFRQTWIHPDDRRYQLIFWRSSPSEPLLVYELCTNTYGLKSSPFISIRCLHQVAYDASGAVGSTSNNASDRCLSAPVQLEEMPRAARLLIKNSYVDDLNGGEDTLEDALELRDELIKLMQLAGYELRKWSSNVPQLLDGLPTDYLETPRHFDGFDTGGLIKVLGIQWDPVSDSFTYTVNLPSDGTVTRRKILSLVARLYDPLGWISPVIFSLKLVLQSLLCSSVEGNENNSRKVEWDSPAPANVVQRYQEIVVDLPRLQEISLPRCLKPNFQARYSLHGFSDGSSLGFSAAVYIRAEAPDGTGDIKLLIAKSRVAPLRTKLTIPKLELNGAKLLTALLNHVVSHMEANIRFDEVIAWCDSTIVLAWLRTPAHRLQVFEGNRVSEINSSKINITWRHVPSEMNCADIASRGSTAAALLTNDLWWNPQWLSRPSNTWPKNYLEFPSDLLPGLRAQTKLVNIGILNSDFDLLERFSSFDKLINVTAYLLRFANNCKNKNFRKSGNILVSERRNAILCLIRQVQEAYFGEDICNLKSGKIIKNHLRRLSLFIDNNNLLRVGGRIKYSDLSYDARHPILLPSEGKFTELLVTHYHQVYCHVGANTLAAILSRNYWIISARRITRQITFKCIQCYRSRAKPTQPYMADLPPDRIRGVRPFLGVATDFAGPYFIKSSTLRNPKIQKCYLCVFVCLATKAVHLEIVADLSVEAFVAAFTRFVSRRGLPSLIRSDCGTNFTGTDKYLKELYIFLRDNHSDLERKLTKDNITWLFNAPASPNFGGLFESAVKSAKTHARRVIGDTKLTFEELTTLFTKIEAILNSRPLCPLSTDPMDLEVLTPGHFLIGQPLVALPEYPYTELKDSRLSRYQQIQKMSQHFWLRWRNEYLHTLQQRCKWTSVTEPPKLDDLVLIKDENLSPLTWRRGRVVKLLPGKDSIIRVAEIKTQGGILMRPVSKLCRLPLIH